jgi:hypothetical protein
MNKICPRCRCNVDVEEAVIRRKPEGCPFQIKRNYCKKCGKWLR